MKTIPVEGDGFRHIRRKRRFSMAYASAEDCPKSSMKEQNRARIEAKQLEAMVNSMMNDVPTKYGYMCAYLTCESCERTPAPACSGIVPGLEFLAALVARKTSLARRISRFTTRASRSKQHQDL